jgi:hypothetical protein
VNRRRRRGHGQLALFCVGCGQPFRADAGKVLCPGCWAARLKAIADLIHRIKD